MATVLEQLLRLKTYPAKLLIGRATSDGVLVLKDDHRIENPGDAKNRIIAYESINTNHLNYRYEVVPLADVESVMSTMRLDLQKEAHDKGLPTRDWK